MTDDSIKILKEGICVRDCLKEQCPPNMNLALDTDALCQMCNYNDVVDKRTLFLKVCFIHWLQENTKEYANELYFKATFQQTTISKKKLSICVDNKSKKCSNLTHASSSFKHITLQITN